MSDVTSRAWFRWATGMRTACGLRVYAISAGADLALPALREELRELRPFLAEALTPKAVIDLSARVAELVARIGDDR